MKQNPKTETPTFRKHKTINKTKQAPRTHQTNFHRQELSQDFALNQFRYSLLALCTLYITIHEKEQEDGFSSTQKYNVFPPNLVSILWTINIIHI